MTTDLNPAAEARRLLHDLGELPADRDDREALVWRLIERCETLEADVARLRVVVEAARRIRWGFIEGGDELADALSALDNHPRPESTP